MLVKQTKMSKDTAPIIVLVVSRLFDTATAESNGQRVRKVSCFKMILPRALVEDTSVNAV